MQLIEESKNDLNAELFWLIASEIEENNHLFIWNASYFSKKNSELQWYYKIFLCLNNFVNNQQSDSDFNKI